MAIRIITDSAADFDREVAKRRKIDIVSLSVQFGSASFLDGKKPDHGGILQTAQGGKGKSQDRPALPRRFPHSL